MDSDDEIAVARHSKVAVNPSTPTVAPAQDTGVECGKARLSEEQEWPETERAARKTFSTKRLPRDSSRSSSPLSDVDEGVLQIAPTSKLKQIALEEESPSPRRSASTLDGSTELSDLSTRNFTSSSPGATTAKSSEKRSDSDVNMQTTGEPPPKRRRGRPRKNPPKEVASPNSSNEGPVDDLDLNITKDRLGVRPTRKAVLSAKSSLGNRPSTRTRMPSASDEDDDDNVGSTRLRERQAAKDKYKPLHLYEESNWVLFDPLKEFPLPSPFEFLRHYTYYKPGNDRILEYNLISNSVRSKWTPRALRGKAIRYGRHGPKFE